MELLTKAPRGTADLLPTESFKWQYVENILKNTVSLYNFKEVRTPTFEHTELFERGVGEGTDVVQKEMYTFQDKGNRSVTLRPEGTAGAVRLMLENGLYGGALPLKLYYLSSCFRYEKPQAGRLREFHQFGVEMFGTDKPFADAEIISLAHMFFINLGIRNLSLEINSIGCKECRAKYYDQLKAYFDTRKNELCSTCNERLARNPMRLLDCKSSSCALITKDAPKVTDYLCEECNEHFEAVKNALTHMKIEFLVNSRIVRGLDYYNRTVFEFVSNEIGTQGTVCGGGRYDGLAKELGNEDIYGLGFGLGIERLIMLMEKQGLSFGKENKCKIFIANIGNDGAFKALELVNKLRNLDICAELDLLGRSLKAQMKYADKIGAQYTVVIGDDEVASGFASLKNMLNGEKIQVQTDLIEKYLV